VNTDIERVGGLCAYERPQLQRDAAEFFETILLEVLSGCFPERATVAEADYRRQAAALKQQLEALARQGEDYGGTVRALGRLEREFGHFGPLHRLFAGQVVRGSLCRHCRAVTARPELQSVVSLGLDGVVGGSATTTLQQCLSQQFNKSEEQGSGVGADMDAKVCDSAACRGQRVPAATTLVWLDLPSCLVISLKRYREDCREDGSWAASKLSVRVSFPVAGLDMSDFCFAPDAQRASGRATYDLCAVCVHRGAALNCGHYVAYARAPETGQWLLYDDARVSAVTQEQMEREASENAYMLFYASRASGLE
jgi:ubiquitin C-terminal hydrolase